MESTEIPDKKRIPKKDPEFKEAPDTQSPINANESTKISVESINILLEKDSQAKNKRMNKYKMEQHKEDNNSPIIFSESLS